MPPTAYRLRGHRDRRAARVLVSRHSFMMDGPPRPGHARGPGQRTDRRRKVVTIPGTLVSVNNFTVPSTGTGSAQIAMYVPGQQDVFQITVLTDGTQPWPGPTPRPSPKPR